MSIHDEAEFQGITDASKVAKHLREFLVKNAVPGVTTLYLDDLCRSELRSLGAVSAPMKHYKAPSSAFFSVNHVLVHGLPNGIPLVSGDLLKIDVTPEYAGFISDTACSVVVGGTATNPTAAELAWCAEKSFDLALKWCRPRERVSSIGKSIESRTKTSGFYVISELSGHGVGRKIHEDPSIPNYFDPTDRTRLHEGLVVAIEPMISNRKSGIRTRPDGWSISVNAGSLTAHHEHTVLITRQGPVVLTA